MWQQSLKDVAAKLWSGAAEMAMPSSMQTIAKEAVHPLDEATVSLGRHLRSLAGNLDQRQGSSGFKSIATFAASKSLEKAGRYLEVAGFEGVREDLTIQVKKNPIPFIVAGLGVGILVGRLLLPTRRSHFTS